MYGYFPFPGMVNSALGIYCRKLARFKAWVKKTVPLMLESISE
jgi:hypothetical protein